MSRPSSVNPTPGELEVLKILWSCGECSSRDVQESLNEDGKERAYTSVASLMNVMVDKGLLKRKQQGRAFLYSAKAAKRRTLSELLSDLVGRAFEGSASQLVAHLVESGKLTQEELDQIRQAIDEHQEN
ncbi:BlaI/MecI/CopY family transcriptional regulator [Thalassoglobus polymorphus]|uniref:Penicillinase repressor n=1 Tax=Thalassoglobus polymorphus TaxID=2527994 RepID=A0A517QN17_9PLAN|nr:BlaI/MecI/CopY family transcriptional regulator [Thalassoglobus polymorphus]QDT33038.1 Penicillinase repressor [Thalassoglobus polymorphus]